MTKHLVSIALLFIPLISFGQYQLLEQLEGVWVSDKDSTKMEIWEKGEEDGFEGRSIQVMEDGSEKAWEALRIFNNDGVLTYEANVVGNASAVSFTMSYVSENEILFSNENHDFPKHIHYWFEHENHLKVEVYADKKGKKLIFQFTRKPKA